LAATIAISYLGRLLSTLLHPILPRLTGPWNRGFHRFVERLDGVLTPRSRRSSSLANRPALVPDPGPQKGPLLRIQGLQKNFGGVVAVDKLDLEVAPGEFLGLIGPNGSGKTTVFNLISGVYPIDGGQITFAGNSLARKTPTAIVLGGISRTFQNIRLFGNMTVLENVQTALHTASDYNLLEAFLQWPWTVWKTEQRQREEALALLEVVGIAELKDRPANTLPYGLQRKLEIARALALNPRLLLLDEPAAGMNPKESLELVDLIRTIHQKYHLTIILIEHHMDVVMSLCQRIIVLNFGRKIAEGVPEAIQNNEQVLEAYLGDKVDYAPVS
jgi:ABC-type branched-subunit amino acid transport system ATPase component